MPTFYQSEERLEQELREGELERSFALEVQARAEAQEVLVIKEKGKVALERLRMTHRANSRASMWITFFSIIPKTVLIISCFWLVLFHRDIPKSWNEYISR